jgi:hypothetical protein
MKRFIFIAIMVAALSLGLSEAAIAQVGVTVRGRLIRMCPEGFYPAVNIAVSIGNAPPTVSGFDGMYYFYNVPPGNYPLFVWVNPRIQIAIFVHYPYTDLPQLQVP